MKRIPTKGDARPISKDEVDPAAAARRKAVFVRGNELAFATECARAGITPSNAPWAVSPALAADVAQHRKKMAGWAEDSEREAERDRPRREGAG